MNTRLKNTILFFALTYICTWCLYFAIVLLKLHPYNGTGMILLLLGGCAPTYVGFIMAMATNKKEGRLNYLRRIIDVKNIKAGSWAIILLLFPFIVAVSVGISLLFGASMPEMLKLKAIIASPMMWFLFILLSFISGPFSEELGWRGFALDPLLERFVFIKANIFLGIVWCLWHLPLYFMPETWHGQTGFAPEGFWSFLMMSIGLSMVISFVHIRSNRSILAAMLLHLSSNFSVQMMEGSSVPLYPPVIDIARSLLLLITGIFICIHMVNIKKNDAANYLLDDKGVPVYQISRA